jgi:hypothetical protein
MDVVRVMQEQLLRNQKHHNHLIDIQHRYCNLRMQEAYECEKRFFILSGALRCYVEAYMDSGAAVIVWNK